VSWTVFDTEIGTLFAAFTRRGICALQFFRNEESHTEELRRRFEGNIIYDASVTRSILKFVRNYLLGNRPMRTWELDLNGLSPFDVKVLSVAASIPYGSVASYGDVARAAGVPRASRAVGGAMRRNPLIILVPCHRVVRSDGSLGGYGGGLHIKERLLEMEGVSISDGRIDLRRFRHRFPSVCGH